MKDLKKKIVVLVSGSGTNLQAVIDAIKTNVIKNTEISLVISNKENAFALQRAEREGIQTCFINPKEFSDNIYYDKKLIEIISKYNPDLIILAGYTKILTSQFINSFKNKIINIHPSLLPAFGGKGMYGQKVHEAVLKSKIKESGCTVHIVTENVDAGPIIGQTKVPIMTEDTVKTLSERILKEEHKLLIDSINKILFSSSPTLENILLTKTTH